MTLLFCHSGLRPFCHSELDSESHSLTDCKGRNNLKPSQLVGDSGSNLDYSGGRKTHRFPPPYGLGSLSLTHRPTENPTGVTLFVTLNLQGILNHVALCSAVQNDAINSPYGALPIPTFPNQGKEQLCRKKVFSL